MNTIEMLKVQTESTYKWVNTLLESIPFKEWDTIPDNLATNVTWQVGHLILSVNYHSIMAIKGPEPELYQKFPIQEYARLFIKADPAECIGLTDAEELLEHFKMVQKSSISIISQLLEEELEHKLEPTKVPHPVANNKFEALDWNNKHTMWHCGQLGILKRIVDQRYDFGLKF
ncbi:DinB family protein [Flammeovirga kamogawensis]|uniref:DinB family protein n=1 Tax=Flammeovirga kamogawensis TaxID=373891 RepID=A0ABX8H1B5_9BACT|nr:DinB family protein [Flammeovirga kamogawensis]MBB6462222.1 hypothetical protein [Flammeovirga kamogawensis]QWG09377.1 DinB family protein [Flammeovirga kamogawensis]TRX64895.1 DinB family protein [Flammeovirga kamogawensis]